MYSGLLCIRIAANNRIMIPYRLFSPNCPNFVSGNHRIQTLQLTEQIIDNQVGLCYCCPSEFLTVKLLNFMLKQFNEKFRTEKVVVLWIICL